MQWNFFSRTTGIIDRSFSSSYTDCRYITVAKPVYGLCTQKNDSLEEFMVFSLLRTEYWRVHDLVVSVLDYPHISIVFIRIEESRRWRSGLYNA